jgi:hypothetical protein
MGQDWNGVLHDVRSHFVARGIPENQIQIETILVANPGQSVIRSGLESDGEGEDLIVVERPDPFVADFGETEAGEFASHQSQTSGHVFSRNEARLIGTPQKPQCDRGGGRGKVHRLHPDLERASGFCREHEKGLGIGEVVNLDHLPGFVHEGKVQIVASVSAVSHYHIVGALEEAHRDVHVLALLENCGPDFTQDLKTAGGLEEFQDPAFHPLGEERSRGQKENEKSEGDERKREAGSADARKALSAFHDSSRGRGRRQVGY